jgi:DNA-binding transcriptional LysR family regulator
LQVSTPLEFGSLDAMLGCVAAGVGVTLLPKGVVAAAWREGRVAVHDVAPEDARVDTLFVRRRDVYASTAITAFLEIARPVAAPALVPA